MEILEKVKNKKKSKIHHRTFISYIRALESMKKEWLRVENAINEFMEKLAKKSASSKLDFFPTCFARLISTLNQ